MNLQDSYSRKLIRKCNTSTTSTAFPLKWTNALPWRLEIVLLCFLVKYCMAIYFPLIFIARNFHHRSALCNNDQTDLPSWPMSAALGTNSITFLFAPLSQNLHSPPHPLPWLKANMWAIIENLLFIDLGNGNNSIQVGGRASNAETSYPTVALPEEMYL